MSPAPAKRLALIRVLVGLYAVIHLSARFPHALSFTTLDPIHFKPIGVVSLLSSPLPAWGVQAIATAALLSVIVFTLGWRHRVTGPIAAALLTWQLTYTNSWGQILHTTNLLVVYVIVLAVSPAADALSLDARRRGPPSDAPHGAYGWPIRLMALLCALAYVIAGIAKLKGSGWAYFSGDTLQFHIAFDNVRKIELGSLHSPLGAWLLSHTNLLSTLGPLALLLELGAPFALLHRRVGAVWAISMWCFHLGVLLLMLIFFAFQLFGLAFLPFFRAERLLNTRLAQKILDARPEQK